MTSRYGYQMAPWGFDGCDRCDHRDHRELMRETMCVIEPWVRHGLKEAKVFGTTHALCEATAITYLIGRGYPPHAAHRIVESWWHR